MSKVVLITGASFGMRKLTAEFLSKNNYIVYAGTREENSESTLKNIKNIYIDVTKTNSIKSAISLIKD